MDSKLPTPKSYCELGASFTKARKFGVGPKTESEISMDLKSFALQIEKEAPELSEKTKALIESLDAFVLYARRDPEEPEAYGVSLYSPHSGEKTLKAYTQVSLSKTWSGFLENYLERTCADFLEPKISKRGAAFRVEDDSGLDPQRTDVVDETVRVLFFFDMERDVFGLERSEKIDEEGVVLYHQMDVEGFGGSFGYGVNDDRSDREIGDEMAVHHIDVHKIASRIADGADIAGQIAEIGGEDTRSDEHGQHLGFFSVIVPKKVWREFNESKRR